MVVEYRDHKNISYPSRSPMVFCASDIHMGNSRKTNDLTGHTVAEFGFFLKYLHKQLAKYSERRPSAFDLVLNGDVFDFWKSIPDPLPRSCDYLSSGTSRKDCLKLGSKEDYVRRFNEIIDHNRGILSWLVPVIYDKDLENGCTLIILPGNHDDIFPTYEPLFRKKLIEGLVNAAIENGYITDTPANRKKWAADIIGPRLKTNRTSYWNKKLKVYAEHGERFDNHNRLREISNQNVESQGQLIVEGLLNWLHDLNLNSSQHWWRIWLKNNPSAQLALRLIDNFENPVDAVKYIENAIKSKEAKESLNVAFIENLKYADMHFFASLASLTSFSRNLQNILNSIFRKSGKKKCRQAADKILEGKDQRVLTVTGGVKPKIVLLGHTHVNDAVPLLKDLINQPKQYINTGTFVDHYISVPSSHNESIRPLYAKIFVDPQSPNQDIVVVNQINDEHKINKQNKVNIK